MTHSTTTPTTTTPAQRRGGLGPVWAGLAASAVVLVLLLVFILENSDQTEIEYFGASGHLPLGVMILLGAVAGVVLTLLVGGARAAQLRLRRRHS